MSSQSEAIHSKNRNFICSCGKAYLSYAALFTHIKQKHGGKAPGQITRPRSQNKRGRPRKNDKLTSEKGPKSESYNGFLDNNNLKNINFANELNFNQNCSRLQNIQSKGFRTYKNQKQISLHKQPLKRFDKGFQSPSNSQRHLRSSFKQDDDENMQFMNPNNQFSSNTIALASIIIGLQQLFKQVGSLEVVNDDRLEWFSTYSDLKYFHSKKLLKKDQKAEQVDQGDPFLLGNILCAFLNFCHQTIQEKEGYQQVVLLIVCLLQHIKEKKIESVLMQCRKEAIHECLPSFFQQYLEKVIIKAKLNFWIFKQNNSFKVLIWFLNWLSVIEVNSHKNAPIKQSLRQDQIQQDDFQVQFDHPIFLKQIQKSKQTPGYKNKSNHKKNYQNQISNNKKNKIEQSAQNESSSNDENQLLSQGSDPQDENNEDSEFDPNQSQKKQLIQMERLSSQVR